MYLQARGTRGTAGEASPSCGRCPTDACEMLSCMERLVLRAPGMAGYAGPPRPQCARATGRYPRHCFSSASVEVRLMGVVATASYPRHSGLRTKGQGTVQYSVVTTEPSSSRCQFQAAWRGADNRTHPPPTGPSAPARRHALWLPPQWLLSAPSLAGCPPGPPQCDCQVRLVSRTNN